MVRKCSFLRNIVGQRWSVVDRGSERFALVPAPSDQIGPMHDLGYELLIAPFLKYCTQKCASDASAVLADDPTPRVWLDG
jgi:hypothetical protein